MSHEQLSLPQEPFAQTLSAPVLNDQDQFDEELQVRTSFQQSQNKYDEAADEAGYPSSKQRRL